MPSPAWRPCCGSCRSERLTPVVSNPRFVESTHHWQCLDCGANWDGTELSAAEAAERPAPPPLPADAPESKPP